MQPLIDFDVLVYETGFAAEASWKHINPESDDPPSFDMAAEILDQRIGNICAMVEATLPPILYLTGKTNFRNDIAKRQPYKQRIGNKPFHYSNIKAYGKGKYNVIVKEGLEADDLMAIEQTNRPDETIICTRDKDLRQVPGWHYSWELENQPQFGPMKIDELGWIELLDKSPKKLIGGGNLFFYAQCLMGDPVDSIPGLGGRTGPVGAFKILEGSTTSLEAFKRVLEAYRASYGDSAEEELLEQGRLLHMTRKLHDDGTPVLWQFPEGWDG